MKKNKKITLIATLALIGAIGVGSTFAYFTDTAEATNTVKLGHVDIELQENAFDDLTLETKIIENVVPGQKIAKDPTVVVAADSEPALLRAKITVAGADKEELPAAQKEAIESMVAAAIEKNDECKWVLKADGYYYCVDAEGKALTVTPDGKEVLVPIFTSIDVPTSWNNDFADCKFTIDVKAEAIQAANFNELNADGSWDVDPADIIAY